METAGNLKILLIDNYSKSVHVAIWNWTPFLLSIVTVDEQKNIIPSRKKFTTPSSKISYLQMVDFLIAGHIQLEAVVIIRLCCKGWYQLSIYQMFLSVYVTQKPVSELNFSWAPNFGVPSHVPLSETIRHPSWIRLWLAHEPFFAHSMTHPVATHENFGG